MKRILTRLHLLIALSLVGALVLSACTMPDQSNVVTAPGTELESAEELDLDTETAGTTGPAGAQAVDSAGLGSVQNMLVTATSLLDMGFQNQNGEDMGEIEDFIVNMQNGQILYTTIEYGGLLEIGDTEVAVPLSAFRWSGEGDLMLNVDERVLEGYPDLDENWANFSDPAWDDQAYGFWQNAGVNPGYNNAVEASNSLARASEVIGYGVEDIGFGGATVDNMLIDLSQGVASYVVFTYQPGVFENESVAVPFSAVTWQGVGTNLGFAEGFNQDLLASAPSFAAGDLERGVFNSTWGDNLTSYWSSAGFAGAQAVPGNQTTSEAAQPAATDATGQGSAAPTGSMGVVGVGNAYILGSTLLDYDFDSIDGDTSGEIEDIIIDTASGRILFVTVEYGGFLEIGDTELPMPLSAFQVGPDGGLLLRFADEVLADFPDLGTNLNDFADPAWEDDVVTFWRSVGFDPGFDITETANTTMRASALTGYAVADVGYDTGTVEDMIVSLSDARVPYVLVNYDALGIDNELSVVPFSAFDPSRFGAEFAFDEGFDGSMLETAPTIDAASFGAESFDPAIFSDWDTYWVDRGFTVTEVD